MTRSPMDADELRRRVRDFLGAHDPASLDRLTFLRERFDAGLAWISFPVGLGGIGAPRALQPVVDREFAAAGAPDNQPLRIGIGLGMAAPTILKHGTDEQRRRYLRPLWTGEEVWCQLFSEPGAGSDLAALGTRAVRALSGPQGEAARDGLGVDGDEDRKSTRLNSSHVRISYAVFCLKKKKKKAQTSNHNTKNKIKT